MTDRASPTPTASRWTRPRAAPSLPLVWLALAAALSVGVWLLVELTTVSPTNARYAEMIAAARTVQAASRVLYAAKQARGLLPPAGSDPTKPPADVVRHSDEWREASGPGDWAVTRQ